MLFCSQKFVLFYCAIFIAYWSMSNRWARGGLLILSGSYFLHSVWTAMPILTGASWLEWLRAEKQAIAGDGFWISGIVTSGTALAYLVGHHRARISLLLAASFFFYASW